MKRVVVTGMGVVAPGATGIEPFRQMLKSGRSAIRFVPELKEMSFNCCIGGIPEIADSPYLHILQQYNLADAGTAIQYALLAGLEAWHSAGLTLPSPDDCETDPDTGIIIGSGIGSLDVLSEKLFTRVNERKHLKIKSTVVEQLLFSASPALLSGILAAGNYSGANSNACSTGTEAVILGYDLIRLGRAKRILAGSTEGYTPYYWAAFDALRVTTSLYNENPVQGSRPLSASASGFVPAAGAAVIVLEELEYARTRNADILCEIAGGFLNSGGQRNGGTMTAPNPVGVVRCIQGALKDAKIKPRDIDYISGHLSSTMADVLEIKNWTEALNRHRDDFPYINSLKSLVGHCLGAAGSVETVAAILQLKEQFLHPSLNCEDVHPEIAEKISADKIPMHYRENVELNYVAKTSFGFGDVNACLILKKYVE